MIRLYYYFDCFFFQELLVDTENNQKLKSYRLNLNEFQSRRWKNEWDSVMSSNI
jgi:hypothetical protein